MKFKYGVKFITLSAVHMYYHLKSARLGSVGIESVFLEPKNIL